MQLSIEIEELLPIIEKHIRAKYGIKENIDLIYTSKTRFLTFVDSANPEDRDS